MPSAQPGHASLQVCMRTRETARHFVLQPLHMTVQVRKRKWDACANGEALFGLRVTPYPELAQTQEEIGLLDRLYSLYKAVIDTIRGFGDYFWADVVEQIEAMTDQVNAFLVQAKKLPKVRAIRFARLLSASKSVFI